MKMGHKILAAFCCPLVIWAVLALAHVGTATSQQTTTGAQTPAAATRAKATKAQWELIVSQSSCQENPALAYVNCSIGVRNRGSSIGLPTVYADYRYSDSGESFDQSDNGRTRSSDPIPPRKLGWVYFSHPYNALQHDVIQVAVSLDPNAQSWPYVKVVSPSAN